MRRPAVALNALDAELRLVEACPLPQAAPPSLLSQHLQTRALGLDGAFQPAVFLPAVAVSTNDLPTCSGPDQAHAQRMVAPHPVSGLDALCINRVLDSLCAALPPGLTLHDAPRH